MEQKTGADEDKVDPVVTSPENVGLSIFWAVFAGLSPVVLRRMSQAAEGSLGEEKSGSTEE